MRRTRRMLLTAQQNYEDAGVWKGSTDYVQCLSSLATSAVQSVDGVEHVRVSHVSPHLFPHDCVLYKVRVD